MVPLCSPPVPYMLYMPCTGERVYNVLKPVLVEKDKAEAHLQVGREGGTVALRGSQRRAVVAVQAETSCAGPKWAYSGVLCG